MKKYSPQKFKRLSDERMTFIGEIQIPATPGSFCHAILCSLVDNKNKFVTWNRLLKLVEEYMVMFGGEKSWKKFSFAKSKNLDGVLKKIKTNIHSLTRTGKNNQGYKLHERGIAIYYFKDGAMARTGGKYIPAKGRKSYDVRFHDGTGIQLRFRGKLLSYREYKDFVGNNWYEESEEDIII
jgi:hypothetical protein